MKKPIKAITCVRKMYSCGECHECLVDKGYNKACNDWEKYYKWVIEQHCLIYSCYGGYDFCKDKL